MELIVLVVATLILIDWLVGKTFWLRNRLALRKVVKGYRFGWTCGDEWVVGYVHENGFVYVHIADKPHLGFITDAWIVSEEKVVFGGR